MSKIKQVTCYEILRNYLFLTVFDGPVCPPLESPVISYEPEERSVNSLEITDPPLTPRKARGLVCMPQKVMVQYTTLLYDDERQI